MRIKANNCKDNFANNLLILTVAGTLRAHYTAAYLAFYIAGLIFVTNEDRDIKFGTSLAIVPACK